MLTMEYREWQRYEAALGLHTRTGETCWDRLDELQGMGPSCHFSPLCQLACALGVEKRRHLPIESHNRNNLWMSYGTWTATYDPLVGVTGFPSSDSAINALERLLGRAEYENLFPTPAIAK